MTLLASFFGAAQCAKSLHQVRKINASPFENQRQRRPEVDSLSFCLSVKSKFQDVLCTFTYAQKTTNSQGLQLRGKIVCVRGEQFNVANLTKPCRVLQRLAFATRFIVRSSPGKGQINQHRFGQHFGIPTHPKTQRAGQIGRLIFPAGKWGACIVIRSWPEAQTERTGLSTSVRPSLPQTGRTRALRLRF